MNQNHPSPEDAADRGGDTVDPVQLAPIEQQLKRFRPRPAEYNIEAIVRSAAAAGEPVVLNERPEQNRDSRPYRWIGTIAASWTCGAIAGALVTVVLLSRGATPDSASDGIIATQDRTPQDLTSPSATEKSEDDVEQTPHDDSPENVPQWSRSELLVSVMLEPYGRATSPHGGEWRPLRAGNITGLGAAPGLWRLGNLTDAIQTEWNGESGVGDDARQEVHHSDPEPPVTREQLLQELLGVRPDSVL